MSRHVIHPRCSPPPAELAHPTYGFHGVYRIPQLRAWWYEVPKSASTSARALLDPSDSTAAPQPGDVGFAFVRHPICRAISGFHTAYHRAAFRTNATDSACPFERFPYLLRNETSEDERLRKAVATLRRDGSAIAGPECGFAYHHMLSQAFFLDRRRLHKLFDTAEGRPPPPSVLLRVENLHDDFLALCARRNATRWCEERLAHIRRGEMVRLNAGKEREHTAGAALSTLLEPATLDALERYYAADAACYDYQFNRSLVCT